MSIVRSISDACQSARPRISRVGLAVQYLPADPRSGDLWQSGHHHTLMIRGGFASHDTSAGEDVVIRLADGQVTTAREPFALGELA